MQFIAEETLKDFWRATRHIPGWLSKARDRFALSDDEVKIVDQWEEDYVADMKDLEKVWKVQSAAADRALVEEVLRDDFVWARERRKEFLTERIKELAEAIAAELAEFSAARSRDDAFEAHLMASYKRVEHYEKQSDRDRAELQLLGNSSSRTGADHGQAGVLTESQIDRARAIPLDRIVESHKGFILCPLHTDTHPSMSIKKGFGKCFTCGGHIDSIGYLMKVKGMSFRQAVEHLGSI